MIAEKPRLLDLFCGAGGAAMGYHRAGFEVVGVDIKPQKRFPFESVQADALEYVAQHGRDFDAIHASPPCQAYSRLRHLPWLKGKKYWDSLPPTRSALVACGVPWVIENVEGAPLSGVLLCGTMFGLPIYRHRIFEASFGMLGPPHGKHTHVIAAGKNLGNRGRLNTWGKAGVGGHHGGVALKREAMGIDWMTGAELSQAIPPAYTEWIGAQLMRAIT